MYQPGRDRRQIRDAIVTVILDWVRGGKDVCVAFYGHPAVFDASTHEAVKRARAEGFPARIMPGISAEDCLFADLGVDPGESGWQSFDATRFLASGATPDVGVPLILWQISVVGQTRAVGAVDRHGLQELSERLADLYGGDHEVVVYETSPFPVGAPMIEHVPIETLPKTNVAGLSTLFVPPAGATPERSPDDSAPQAGSSPI